MDKNNNSPDDLDMERLNLQSLFEEGERFFIDGKWDNALWNYTRALELQPEHEKAFNRSKEIHGLRGNIGRIVELYSNRARHLVSKHHYREAIETLNHVLQLKPDYYLARLMIADILKEQDNREEAYNEFLKWGMTFKNQGMRDEALLFLQNAYEMTPQDLEIAREISEILMETDRYERASRFYMEIALACLRKKHIQEARTAFKTQTSIEQSGVVLTTLDNLQLNLLEFENRKYPLNALMRVDYNEYKALEQLGRKLEGMGRYEDAIQVYKVFHNLAPEHEDLEQKLGEVYIKLNDYHTGFKYLLMAAEHFLSRGDMYRAAELYDKILCCDPEHPIARHKSEEIAAQMGIKSD
ncbi:MAG: tetratricopeptide repeat protein [Vulcanimicrobiota bacterium]